MPLAFHRVAQTVSSAQWLKLSAPLLHLQLVLQAPANSFLLESNSSCKDDGDGRYLVPIYTIVGMRQRKSPKIFPFSCHKSAVR